MALVLHVTACGGNGEADSTTTSARVDETTTVVDPTAPTLSDLTGTWDNGTLVLEVNDGGEYVIRASGGSTEPLMGGFVARDGEQFSFVTTTTGECPGQTGIYEASFDDDALTLLLVDDPCEMRATGLDRPFTRSGDR